MIRSFRWILFTALFVAPASAEPPDLTYGAEIEVTERNLANFVDVFDLTTFTFDPSDVPDDITRDLLLEPNALEKLPLELREKLTNGLDLKPLEFANALSEQHKLTAEKNQKLEIKNRSGIQANEHRTLIVPGREAPKAAQGIEVPKLYVPENARQVPREKAWQELNDRWNKLSPNERIKVLNPESLSRVRKAKLLIHLYGKLRVYSTGPNEPKDPLNLKFKPGKEELLRSFSWSRDTGARTVLEFRHKPPIKGMDNFMASLRSFTKLAGNETMLLDGKDNFRADSSLHVHIASPKWKGQHSFGTFAILFNDYITMKRLLKGLPLTLNARTQSDDRIEFRVFENAAEDLREYSEILSMEPKHAVRHLTKKMNTMDGTRLTKAVIARLKVADHFEARAALEFVKKYLPSWPDELLTAIPDLLRKNALLAESPTIWDELGRVNRWPENLWRVIPELLQNEAQNANVLVALRHQREWPDAVWAEIPKLLREMTVPTLDILRTQPQWPEAVWNEIPSVFKNRSAAQFVNLTSMISARKDWPESFWRSLVQSLAEYDGSVPSVRSPQRMVADMIASQKEIPPSAWKEIVNILKGPNSEAHHFALAAISKQKEFPPAVWNELPRLIKNEETANSAIDAMRQIASWPESFQAEALKLPPRIQLRLSHAASCPNLYERLRATYFQQTSR